MMKKRMMSWLLVVTMMLSCLPVSAFAAGTATVVASGTCGTGVTWKLDSYGKLVISGRGVMSANVWGWSYYLNSITSVYIEDGVTYIGAKAFEGCRALTSVYMSDSVIGIGSRAFSYCESLSFVEFGSNVKVISENAFASCTALRKISIPSSVTSIGNYAFYGCRSLSDVTIPGGVSAIGEHVFHHCTGLVSVTIEDGVSSIGREAFYFCSSLEQVTFPSSVTALGKDAFWYCADLKRVEFLGNAPTTTNDYDSDYVFRYSNDDLIIYYHEGTTGWPATGTWQGYPLVMQPHTEGVLSAVAATCTATGLTEGSKCAVCGEVLLARTEVPALGHETVTVPAQAPTVDSIGWNEYEYCTRCDYTTYVELPKLEVTKYAITVPAVSNGTVTADKTEAEAGETITVTATPAEGYRLMGIKVDGVAITGNTFAVTGNHEVTAEFATLLNFASTSANVGDVLDLNFRMTVTDVDFEGGYAILTGPQGEQRVDRADWTLSGSGASQRYNITYKGMYSTMMADEVTVVVYDDNGNQMVAPMSDSIRGYTMRALNVYGPKPMYTSLCVLLVDMLVYGATAQEKFGHNVADPADSLLSDAQRALATVEAKPYQSIQEKSHTGNSASATLGSRIELNFTFLKSDVPGAASAKFTFDHAQSTFGAAEVTVPISQFVDSGTKWKVVLNALVAADSRQPVRCEILDADGNVLAWSVDTVAGYVARLIDGNANYKWVESMVIFCDSAHAWFCQ